MLKQACCVEEHSAGPGGGAGASPLRETAQRLCRIESVTALARESAAKAGKAIAAMLTNDGELLDYLEVIGRGRALSKLRVSGSQIPSWHPVRGRRDHSAADGRMVP